MNLRINKVYPILTKATLINHLLYSLISTLFSYHQRSFLLQQLGINTEIKTQTIERERERFRPRETETQRDIFKHTALNEMFPINLRVQRAPWKAIRSHEGDRGDGGQNHWLQLWESGQAVNKARDSNLQSTKLRLTETTHSGISPQNISFLFFSFLFFFHPYKMWIC